jgi:hypothetical protein
MGHESRINVAQRTRFFFDKIIPQPKRKKKQVCKNLNLFRTF